jgi:hypothetical protein
MASNRPSPTQQGLGFEYDEGHNDQSITVLAGIPVLIQAFRSLGLPASVKRNVAVKQRERGYDEATYVREFRDFERGRRRVLGRLRASEKGCGG